MSFEDQVLALLEEGNPISDPNMLDVDPRRSAAYMEALVPGGQLEDLQKRSSRSVVRTIGWAAAGVAAFVVGLTLFFTTQSSEVPPATDPPATTSVVPPPTTAPPTSTVAPPSTTSTTTVPPTTLPSDGSVEFAQFALGPLRFIAPAGVTPRSSHPGIVDVPLTDRSGIIFMAPQQYTSGEAITNAADYLAVIADRTEVSAGPSATILGQDRDAAVAAERSAIPSVSVLPVGVDPGIAFQSPAPAGYDYLLDTPEGLLIIGLYAGDESELPAVEAAFIELVETIELAPPS